MKFHHGVMKLFMKTRTNLSEQETLGQILLLSISYFIYIFIVS